MTDYTQNEDYSVKDGLTTGDPEKTILGSDIDSELGEISTAIASKYDSSDIASQAQAEAGTSNEVLMTPLRVAQYLGGGIGSGSSGALADIGALDDPGDDRILFWDESDDAVEFLDVGSGLSITGNVISVNEGAVDHDSLLNFEANEHIDHSSVSINASAGEGISAGGDLTTSRTLDLDVDGLTEETTLDGENDYFAFYDASATAHRKVNIDALLGSQLGDGKWYRNATQSIGTSLATLVFNTEDYDELQQGTFNTTTGQYTAGASGARLLVHAHTIISSHAAGEDATIQIQVEGTNQAQQIKTNRGKFGASDSSISVTSAVVLGAGEVLRIQIRNDGTKNTAAGLANTYLSIVELG